MPLSSQENSSSSASEIKVKTGKPDAFKPQVEYDPPAWLIPTEDERAQNIIEYDQLVSSEKKELKERNERPNLPAQPTPSLADTYNVIFETIDAVEASAYDRSVARNALSGHQLLWAERNYDKILDIENNNPDVNLHARSWEDKLSGENAPLCFGKGYSVVLEKPEKPMTMTERAAGLIAETARLYVDLNDGTKRAETIKQLDDGNENLETQGYDRMWGMRVAGEDADTMSIANFSNYIVVSTGRNDYQFQVIEDGKPIPPDQIKKNLDMLLDQDKELSSSNPGISLNNDPRRRKYTTFAPLTYLDRRKLYKVTENLSQNPAFKNSLEVLNKALFTVSLDENISPDNDTETAQLAQYGAIIKDGEIDYMNLNTINGSGLGFTVYANGEAGGKAEHLLVDGNEFCNVMSYVNTRAKKVQIPAVSKAEANTSEEDRSNGRRFARLGWSIPANIIEGDNGVLENYVADVLERDMKVTKIEGVSPEVFGKYSDSVLQVAINLAYADIKGEILKSKNRPGIFPVLPEHQTTFYADEPIHMRGYKGGRVGNVPVSGKPLSEYMQEAIKDPNSKDLPNKLTAALKHIRSKVKSAKTKGDAYLTQLMTITSVEKYDTNAKNRNMVAAAKYMRDLEWKFNSLTPTKAMRRLTQPELLGSNGGSKEKLPGLKSFCTVESLIGNGITVGYFDNVFSIRACGDYAPYAEKYTQALETRIKQIKEQFALIDKQELEIKGEKALLGPLRRNNERRRGQIKIY